MNRNAPPVNVVVSAVAILFASALPAMGMPMTAFSTDFSGRAPAEFSGITNTESVQGFAGIGTGSNVFGGDFLRNSTAMLVSPTLKASTPTVLTLTGLAPHTHIDLNFLFAAIDSWDTGSSAGPDYLRVKVDGVTIFRENFANGISPNPDTQGYAPPAGVQLLSRPFPVLGFGGSRDSAWNLGLDPVFDNIPHTASTLTIEWLADGCCWQGSSDESWGIDNVEVLTNLVPEPSTFILLALGTFGLLSYGWRRRA